MPIDNQKDLWDELERAAMDDPEYDREEESVRELLREPEWDAARDMENGES